jgi:hypothetical protein
MPVYEIKFEQPDKKGRMYLSYDYIDAVSAQVAAELSVPAILTKTLGYRVLNVREINPTEMYMNPMIKLRLNAKKAVALQERFGKKKCTNCGKKVK